MQISFSIIMPTYNRRDCIRNAIDSLLAQTYQQFELIIIDDGSTDGTAAYVMEGYIEEVKNGKIIFIKLPQNMGASFARNAGLEKARYNWIGYLDTDNQMNSDFLEVFAGTIEKNPTHEIFYAQAKNRQSQLIIGRKFNFSELIHANYIDLGVFVHSAKIYYELAGFDADLNRLEDWDLIIKYTKQYPPFFVESVLLNYYDGPDIRRMSNCNPYDDNYKAVIMNYYMSLPAQEFIREYQRNANDISRLELELFNLKEAISGRDAEIAAIKSSVSWKIMLPLRELVRWLCNPVSQIKRYVRYVTKLARIVYYDKHSEKQ